MLELQGKPEFQDKLELEDIQGNLGKLELEGMQAPQGNCILTLLALDSCTHSQLVEGKCNHHIHIQLAQDNCMSRRHTYTRLALGRNMHSHHTHMLGTQDFLGTQVLLGMLELEDMLEFLGMMDIQALVGSSMKDMKDIADIRKVGISQLCLQNSLGSQEVHHCYNLQAFRLTLNTDKDFLDFEKNRNYSKELLHRQVLFLNTQKRHYLQRLAELESIRGPKYTTGYHHLAFALLL